MGCSGRGTSEGSGGVLVSTDLKCESEQEEVTQLPQDHTESPTHKPNPQERLFPGMHPVETNSCGLYLLPRTGYFELSNIAKTILASILTYVLVRGGARLLHFNPVERYTLWPGLLIDLCIWIVVFALCSWLVDQLLTRFLK